MQQVANLLILLAVEEFLEVGGLPYKILSVIELAFEEEAVVVGAFADDEESDDVIGMDLVVVQAKHIGYHLFKNEHDAITP